jgi:hypothetical protein
VRLTHDVEWGKNNECEELSRRWLRYYWPSLCVLSSRSIKD